jgi:uncharacterized damage-inducible protein DinB
MSADLWKSATLDVLDGYRRMIDGALKQLSDEELNRRPTDGINSIAVILRHLGGNLLSRWTDFLTTDGEKPARNRDSEFEDWSGDRASLMAFFDSGWKACRDSITALTSDDMTKSIEIRGEKHTVPQAIQRSLTHTAYHVGQIMLIARTVHDGSWQWLTIKPGGSQQHNQQTWGSAAARGAAGKKS